MDGLIIVIIVISAVVSIFGSLSKQAKKTGAPPARAYFPRLSVDAPPAPPAHVDEETCEGSRFQSSEGYAASSEEFKSMEESDYTLQEIKISEDTGIEKRNPDMDLKILLAEADKYAGKNLPEPEEQTVAGRLKLFENNDEVLKAVIYSEIMRPKFKH